MRILRYTAIATALIAVAFGLAHYFLPSGGPPDAGPYLKAVFPEASSFIKVEGGGYPYYKAIGPDGPMGVVFVSTDLSPDVKGYAGPVPVVVGLLPDGRVTAVRMLRNNETPSYSRRVDSPRFTDQFKGKDVSDPFVLNGDVDGVTRATVTARAVTEGVKMSSRTAASDIFGLPVQKVARSPFAGLKDPAFIGLLMLFAASAFLHVRGVKSAIYRDAVLLASIAVVGVYKAGALSLGNLFNVMALRFPGTDNLYLYLLIIGSLLAALLWGRLYCGYVCPYGALQQFLARLPVRKLELDSAVERKAKNIRYAILWLVTVTAFTTGLVEIGNFEPYGTLFSGFSGFSGRGGIFAWGLVGATLGAGLVIPRFWCRFFCPVGAVLGLLSRHSPFRCKERR